MINKREWSICKIHCIKFHLFLLYLVCVSVAISSLKNRFYFKPEFLVWWKTYETPFFQFGVFSLIYPEYKKQPPVDHSLEIGRLKHIYCKYSKHVCMHEIPRTKHSVWSDIRDAFFPVRSIQSDISGIQKTASGRSFIRNRSLKTYLLQVFQTCLYAWNTSNKTFSLIGDTCWVSVPSTKL